MQKMMYLLVSQHVLGIIIPIIRRMVQNRQRLWCTALAVLQKTRAEEVVGVNLLGMVSRLFTFMIQDARSHEIKRLRSSMLKHTVRKEVSEVVLCLQGVGLTGP
jgi:hypothetical protein